MKAENQDPELIPEDLAKDFRLSTEKAVTQVRPAKKSSGELFIIDNSDEEWKALKYLREWCQISKSIDIATGFFEIGALLALDGEWQKVDKIRILMGFRTTLRTHQAIRKAREAVLADLNKSTEEEKKSNDFLTGLPAIVEALKNGKIEVRVLENPKFHAKASNQLQLKLQLKLTTFTFTFTFTFTNNPFPASPVDPFCPKIFRCKRPKPSPQSSLHICIIER